MHIIQDIDQVPLQILPDITGDLNGHLVRRSNQPKLGDTGAYLFEHGEAVAAQVVQIPFLRFENMPDSAHHRRLDELGDGSRLAISGRRGDHTELAFGSRVKQVDYSWTVQYDISKVTI